VLYRPTGANQPVLAGRWCKTLTIVAADGSATSLSQIRPGTSVEFLMASEDWLTSVTVKP
jgi:hypothetical protein